MSDGPRPLGDLTRVLSHRLQCAELLETALTHSSAAASADRSYERLEFLGDRVLGLVVADLLMRRYPNENEGDLARRLSGLVDRDSLADVARALDLGDFIRLSPGEAEAGIRQNTSVLSDVMESVIGAIYTDGGLEAARPVIERLWAPLAERDTKPPTDSKTALQEWVQARGAGLPQYRVVERTGLDHRPVFSVEVMIDGMSPERGQGSSKRVAEQAAAEAMLGSVRDKGDD